MDNSPRDPRIDPKPGDILQSKDGKITRHVIEGTTKLFSMVRVVEVNGRGQRFSSRETLPWISQWRKWAKEAKVLCQGGGE